jgi:excisionase family DNA binding protein
MERLKLKKRIGNVGGVVYFAVSGELRNRKLAFAKECEEPSIDIARDVAVYQCSYPGCPEMVREPGFCREHSPKPRIEGMALTIQQAADELGVSDKTIRRLINSNAIKSCLILGRRVIKRNDIMEYLSTL